MKKICTVFCLLALSGCVQPVALADYRPVVDPGRTNAAKFESDLTACRNIALKVEADYKQQQQSEMATNMIAGLIVGAALGAAVGNSDGAAYGAAYGATAGAASGDYTHDLVKFGPRRIVDRCMTERGHVVLSDLGKG